MVSGITASVAGWTASLRYPDIPSSVLERARLQGASVLGATFAGARSDLGRGLREAAKRWGGDPRASIIPTGPKTSIHTACFVNAAASVAFDFDDYLFAGHTGHSAVLGSIAYGEALGASGADAITGQVAANETAGRLGAAMLLGPHNGQMWAYIHALAGAVVAGRFLDLDAERMGHAIGIALAQPAYPLAPAFFGPDSKALIASGPLVDGIRAAELAAAGLTGPSDVLGDAAGMLQKMSDRPLAFAFTGLGDAWVTSSLAYKLYPGCAYIDTPVDAMSEIMERFADKHGRVLAVADIERINVAGTLFTAGMEAMSTPYRSRDPLRAVDVNFSVGLSFGALVSAGAITPEALAPRALAARRDDICAVADRTTVEHDPALTAQTGGLADVGIDMMRWLAANRKSLGERGELLAKAVGATASEGDEYEPTLDGADFSKLRMAFPARVTLRTTGGEEYAAEVSIPAGAPGRPWDETVSAVRAKFTSNATHLPDAAEALNAVLTLDEADDVSSVVSTLMESR
jgi:2-methylcitrate dehydratase PrpD